MTKKNREIWIESIVCENKTLTMNIGSEWGCCKGFKKAEYKKLFHVISNAIKTEFPNVVINPWSDAPYGMPDFD